MLHAPTSETKTTTTQSKSQYVPQPGRELPLHSFGVAEVHSVTLTFRLRQLLSSGTEVRISQQAYSELVNQPEIPRTAAANRIMLEELGIRQGPTGTLGQRFGVYEVNESSISGGGRIVSQEDARVIAAARVGGGEIWSFDRAFRNNPQSIETNFGVRVAPESSIPLASPGNAADYRTGRQLVSLSPVQISLLEVISRGSPPPSGGGTSGSPPPTGPSTGAGTSTRGTQASSTTSKGVSASIGTPDVRPIQVGGPSARGEAIGGRITLAFQGLNFVLNWINDKVQQGRVNEELNRIEKCIGNTLSPSMGLLLVYHFFYLVKPPPESLLQPGPVFDYIEFAMGRTQDEAIQNLPPSIRGIKGVQTFNQLVWLPPKQPASITAIRTPFPKVALDTFAGGRTKLQDVEWGGSLLGFDDEGESTLTGTSGITLQLLILRLPTRFSAFQGGNVGFYPTSIPVEERSAAEGGSVSVVNLDPTIPFGHVTAACVFPADDLTDAFFQTAHATRDVGGQIRYTNFEKARWVRPENIKVVRRF